MMEEGLGRAEPGLCPASLPASQEDWEGGEEKLGKAELYLQDGCLLAPHVSCFFSQQPQVH